MMRINNSPQHDSSLQQLAQQSETFVGLFKIQHRKSSYYPAPTWRNQPAHFSPDRSCEQEGMALRLNLPALPNGKVYQLWAIDDKPVSAGVFWPGCRPESPHAD